MRAHSLLALLVGLSLAAPAIAQPEAAAPKSAPDILVNGATTRPGKWNRAETDHFIVLSDGGEAELRKIADNLEKLQHLLARLYHVDPQHDEVGKLTVTLFASRDFFRDLGLTNARAAEGPFGGGLPEQRYYDPREDGAVLAVARVDQILDLNTSEARDRDCDNAMENDQDCLDAGRVDHPPVRRAWQALLYSGVAQHFILSHQPAAYPRWYLDGVGALFSSVSIHAEGTVDYANPPEDFRLVLRSYGPVWVGDVVSGRYLEPGYRKMVWTPYHAWLLADFFLYSRLKPERQRSFSAYMAAIAHGTPPAQAASLLGDLRVLQHEFNAYLENALQYAHSDKGKDPGQEPVVTNLSPAQVALIGPRLQLAARLADPDAGHRQDWLRRLHSDLAGVKEDEAHLLLAEAECDVGHDDLCLEQADAVLTHAPENALAMAWKGVALSDKAIREPADRRAADLTAARQMLLSAAQADTRQAMPSIAYFQSFAKAGEAPPAQALMALVRVTRANPAAPEPRLYLAQELLREGRGEMAKAVMSPILYGGYESREKAQAARLLSGGTAIGGGL